jgi:predicted GNAT family N-acyltransferase
MLGTRYFQTNKVILENSKSMSRSSSFPLLFTSHRYDEGALHFLALQKETPIGTVRLLYPPASEKFKLGRLAVRKIARGKGVAQKLIAALEAEAKELGAKEVYAGSQVPVRPLYEKAGYQAIGDGYLDEGQPHIMMLKSLT